jgi:hypothetical protein
MLTWIREKFGTAVIGGIIGLIAFVFVFYGIFSPKSTRGLGDGAVAGTVNGDPISLSEFHRTYQQKLEFFKNMMGGANINDDMLKQFHLREGVFRELVNKKLMLQEAQRLGMVPSDEEIRDRIAEMKVFQVNGQFDLGTYKKVLEANQYTPGGFERMMREDMSAAQWQDYFRNRTHVSDTEIKQQFMTNEDKRNVKFVLLTSDVGKKLVKVDPKEVEKFLATPEKVNLAQKQFDQKKTTTYKGKTFDQAKEEIAHDILAGEHTDEVRKNNDKVADEVLPLLTAQKAGDAKANAVLKQYGVEVKETGLVSRANPYLPGIGQADELMKDMWATPSPVDAKPKKYNSIGWVLVAMVVDAQRPDVAKIDATRDTLIKQIAAKKEREIYEAWTRKLMEKAKIDPNPSVVNEGEQS